MTVKLPLPYRRSRSLAPGNELLGVPGVALDVVGLDVGEDLETGWRLRIERVARAIGWACPTFVRHDHEHGPTLAFTTPADQVETARIASEWALCVALVEFDPCHWGSLRRVASELTATGRDRRAAATAAALVGEDAAVAGRGSHAAAEAQAAPATAH